MPRLAHLDLRGELPAAPSVAGVTLRVLAPASQLWLSGNPADDAFQSALGGLLGAPLPEAGRTAGEETLALWHAPDRWLLVGEAAGLAQRVAAATRGSHCLVSDVTDGLAAFEIAGPLARDLLAQGTSFDLRPAAFGPGQGAATLFAGLRVSLYPWRSDDCLRLHGERASARFLWDWLTTAAEACR